MFFPIVPANHNLLPIADHEMTKRLSLLELIDTSHRLQAEGRRVVQAHGVFDLIHPGTISHLTQAKGMGDVLVVTVIRDKDVRRGPGRPIFNEQQRLLSVLALDMVDYACLVDEDTPYECVRALNPDVFALGQSQKSRDRGVHDKIFNEEREFYFGRCQVMETQGFWPGTTRLVAEMADVYPPETVDFLDRFTRRHACRDILERVDDISRLRVLLVGDTIIDEYHYCLPMGKSAKSPIVVNKYMEHEVFAGGVAAVANHMASICAEVRLLTVLGQDNSRREFLEGALKPNVRPSFFERPQCPTVTKTRFIHHVQNQKLFEINYLRDDPMPPELEAEIIRAIEAEAGGYDLAVVSDFGHGMVTPGIAQAVRRCARVMAVNTQTNGANAGFNLITRYKAPDFVCLDETEARLALQLKHAPMDDVVQKLFAKLAPKALVTTLGRKGSIAVDPGMGLVRNPVFSLRTVDTVGAGDAFFSYASLAFALGLPLDLISFLGNAAGALAVQIVGNKKSVEKRDLLEYITILFKTVGDITACPGNA